MKNDSLLNVVDLSVCTARQPHDAPLINEVSFDLKARQVLGVIGESGSGKTILARALVGSLPSNLRVTGGTVNYRGQDLARMTQREIARIRGKEIGYISSNPTSALDPTLPIGDQIIEKLRSVRPELGEKAAREKVLELIEAVRIPSPTKRFSEHPFQFSGGMMQRMMIVDALVSDPAFLVADNITQPLDVTVAAQIIRLLRELVDRLGTAIVFVSSSFPIVCEVADDVLVLQKGRLIERNAPKRLLEAPAEPYTIDLVSKIPRIWSMESRSESRTDRRHVGDQILGVHGISKTYHVRDRSKFNHFNAVKAVRNVSFEVATGENFGIVGESGCEKSTLSRLLTWLEQPDEGTIIFDGNDLSWKTKGSLRVLRRSFQLLLQDPYNSLPPRHTVGKTITEPLRIHGLASSTLAKRRAFEVMAEVGLAQSLFNELPIGLSAGQRQRINIARALILEPKLLILDETLSSLDQAEQARLLDLFERLQQQRKLTYLYISHDLAMVRRVCGRVAVMYLGEVVELAANATLFRNPGHPYSKALLSAVPTLDESPFQTENCLLDGEPPSPIDLPSGCGFLSRCPNAFDRCRTHSPALMERGEGNAAACFLVG
jgi:peptide/nickel transport system ATP-binding protein